MSTINKIGAFLLGVMLTASLLGCEKAEKEFVHATNTISQMVCKASHGASEFIGDIYEYDKSGTLMTGNFTQQDVEGGYGIIMFEIPQSLADDVPLNNIYLVATVTYDEFITPSLSGKHDITGDGIIITVKSGVGTQRQYRVRGKYE